MATNYTTATILLLLLCFFHYTTTPSSAALVKQQPLTLKYHNGALLKGKVTINLIWYGKFTPAQRSIIVDFIQSLSLPPTPRSPNNPSASTWWRTTEKYKSGATNLVIGKQVLHENYPFGKLLKNSHISVLGRSPATAGPNTLPSINVVLTAEDVAVERFCMRCGSHGSVRPNRKTGAGSRKVAYIWVGNSATQCPGQCAWPFKQPMYGPQTPPLIPPNGDVGVDGMIINLATLLAGTVTNPFEDGYFQGPANAPLEAVSACTGMFGSGAYPGYPGKVLVDKNSGASFNAYGVNGRKFLLPAMWDPSSSACSTLV